MKLWVVLIMVACALATTGTARGATTPGFVDRVLPLLTKAGCNSGTCHGSAVGQGGFKLSLLGYDPAADYDHISRELGGRRLHLGSPEESLILRKAALRVAHGGGRRLLPGSPSYLHVLRWIANGAPFGDTNHRVTSLTVTPASADLQAPGDRVRIRVVAAHADGRSEDVTQVALYTPLDEALTTVSPDGLITMRGRGAGAVMVRYRGQVAVARAAVPIGKTPISQAGWTSRGIIDDRVFFELSHMRIAPSPLADDAQFVRRVYLDLIGTLPTPDEARDLLKRPLSQADRAALVDRLLARPEFVDYWTFKLADLLLINGKRMGEKGAAVYDRWLRRQVEQGTPLDRLARDLILATGDPNMSGPPNFYRQAGDPRDVGEFVSRTFLGIRVQCARCHNHPFDRWTQDDYYSWAAVFARVRQVDGKIAAGDRGEVPLPRTGKDAVPRALSSKARVERVVDRRELAAGMVSGPGGRPFAASMANRIWKHLLGRGIVEPVDDLRPTNPPSNPALLEALADELVRLKYDLRGLIRAIALSRTYQASSAVTETNRSDTRLFSHAYVKPMPAVVMADAISQTSGVPAEYPGRPSGTRAIQLADSQTESFTLDVLGRCSRDTGCEDPAQFGGGLSQALHLVVGPAINGRLRSGVVAELCDNGKSDGQIVEELYLRTLSRAPSSQERAHWAELLRRSRDRRGIVEDLLWALLNSREFAFIH